MDVSLLLDHYVWRLQSQTQLKTFGMLSKDVVCLAPKKEAVNYIWNSDGLFAVCSF